MLSRKLAVPLAVLVLAIGTQAIAAKPVETQLLPIPLFNITADGELDLESEGPQALALVEIYYKRGQVLVELESYGDVENLSGRRFRTTNPEDFGVDLGPDIVITKFDYTVSKSGRATLKLTALGDTLVVP